MTVFVNHFYYLLACSVHHAIDKMTFTFYFFLPQNLEHRLQKKSIPKKSETLIGLDYSI